MAGVEHALGAGGDRGLDRGTVLTHGLATGAADGDDEDLGCALEGVCEAGGVGEVPVAHAHPPLLEVLDLLRVADARGDRLARSAFE